MKRTGALVVMAAMICSNCAARGPALRVDRPLASRTPLHLMRGQAESRAAGRMGSGSTSSQDADVWRRYAAQLPIGSIVRVRTTGGERLTAVLLTLDEAGITVMPKTRIPEPARQVAFDRLAQLELARDGSNLAKAAAVGGAVGAGVFVGMLMLLFANVD
jgi:hypothetical protein